MDAACVDEWLQRKRALGCIRMMNTFIIFIRILPPQVEIYKVFEPYLGINFGILRCSIRAVLHESRSQIIDWIRARRFNRSCIKQRTIDRSGRDMRHRPAASVDEHLRESSRAAKKYFSRLRVERTARDVYAMRQMDVGILERRRGVDAALSQRCRCRRRRSFPTAVGLSVLPDQL
jgi:hypothetical protein